VQRAGPSLTARWIAAQRARLVAARPVGVDGDPDAEQRLYAGFSRLLALPGLGATGLAARTKFFDDETAAALARGVDQIVIVGAGYDGRPLRFRTPGVRWIEVDHPATQPDKCRRLASLGVPLDHIAFVAVDLIEDDLATALAAVGHRGDRASLFICEGLFSYLPLSISVSVCRALRSRATPDSVLAASFLVSSSPRAASRAFQRAIDGLLSVVGEIRATKFRSGEPEQLLQQSSWTILGRTALPARGLDAGGPLLLSARPRDDTTSDETHVVRPMDLPVAQAPHEVQ
jgi:methyltransferase (TIGR00027 family)